MCLEVVFYSGARSLFWLIFPSFVPGVHECHGIPEYDNGMDTGYMGRIFRLLLQMVRVKTIAAVDCFVDYQYAQSRRSSCIATKIVIEFGEYRGG